MFNWQPLKANAKFGFSLIEVLVVMAVGILLLGALYGTYVTGYQSYRRSITKAELAQNGRIALERISRDLRQTNYITTTLPPNNSDPLNPPSNRIQFQDGHFPTAIRYIEYSLDDNKLNRKTLHYSFSSDPNRWVAWNSQDIFGNPAQEVTDATEVKADKITSLKFYGTNIVNIEINVTDQADTFYFKTVVLARNI